MFHYDRGLKLTRGDLAIDIPRRQPRAFVSHAHSDHMARHELALCTPETARLYQLRLGRRPVLELPYRTPMKWGGLRLTTYPAGHCLGSAMLLAEDGEQQLLYTGDFKLSPSATAEQAELPTADLLVMECTYGSPQYRRAPRESAVELLIQVVREALAREQTPVIQAYALGKAQEVTRLLTSAGIAVLQPPTIWEVSQVYEACGVPLGDCRELDGAPMPGCAVVVPPGNHRGGGARWPKRGASHGQVVTIAVTGWAQNRAAKYRLGVDHAIPLSDHADFDELLEAIDRVAPRAIYCTHGPASFAEHLRERGLNAHVLGRQTQGMLF